MARPDRLGDFEIVEEIGRGGFGVVYEARQLSLDRPVALKVLYRNLIHTEDQISRFQREAQAAARLDHPAIVSVYAWGEANDDFFIAQKLVGHGRTVADELAALREDTTPPTGYFREVASRLAAVAEALQQAHERGIVHRDVKPSNILLDDAGRPFLGDFGLAKVEDGLELSRTGDLAGSPFYMSPEQADSRRGGIGPPTDVYSLGVTLYECLTLRQPFTGASSHEIVRRILGEEPRAPSRIQPRVPRDLETICLKAMEKVPERRYPSAGAMAADLRSFLHGEPISAEPISATTRLVRKVRRQRVPITVGALGLLLATAALYFGLMFGGKPSEEEQLQAEAERKSAMVVEGIRKELDEQMEQAIEEGDMARVAQLHEQSRKITSETEQALQDLARTVIEMGDSEMVKNATVALQDVVDRDSLANMFEQLAKGGGGLAGLVQAMSGPAETDASSRPRGDEVAEAMAGGLVPAVIHPDPTDTQLATTLDRVKFLYGALRDSDLFASAAGSQPEVDAARATPLLPTEPGGSEAEVTAPAAAPATAPRPPPASPDGRRGFFPRWPSANRANRDASRLGEHPVGGVVPSEADVRLQPERPARTESPTWMAGLRAATRLVVLGGKLAQAPDRRDD